MITKLKNELLTMIDAGQRLLESLDDADLVREEDRPEYKDVRTFRKALERARKSAGAVQP